MRTALLALATATLAGAAAAQQISPASPTTVGPVVGPSGHFAPTASAPIKTDGRVYRLNDNTTQAQGCIPPCLCPIQLTDNVIGTFNLGRPKVSGTVREFPISDVNWLLAGDTRVTGQGIFTLIDGFAGPIQQLTLELSFDGGAPVFYDSGFENGTSFPDIQISVSESNFAGCFDSWFDIDASPVPKKDLEPYILVDPSSYQQGCFPPCLCPIQVPQDMKGSFQLVPLTDGGTFIQYAFVNVHWNTDSPYFDSLKLDGAGIYTRISGFAGWFHDLKLTLSTNGGAPEHFAGNENGGGNFPLIDIVVSQNELFCFDTKLDIHAIPAPVISPAAGN